MGIPLSRLRVRMREKFLKCIHVHLSRAGQSRSEDMTQSVNRPKVLGESGCISDPDSLFFIVVRCDPSEEGNTKGEFFFIGTVSRRLLTESFKGIRLSVPAFGSRIKIKPLS